MSNTDSFIDEVTEEVRRDRLFATLKRWGWIGGVAVLLLVGGASYNEWRKVSERAAAQAFGDGIIEAIAKEDGGLSLLGLPTQSDSQTALAGHLAAADALTEGNPDLAREALLTVEQATEAPVIYRDLAALKAAMAMSPDTPAAERIAAFDALSAPGAPFRLLAQEQKALVLISDGDSEGAVALLRSLVDEAGTTPGLQRRAAELIVALGADLGQETDANGG